MSLQELPSNSSKPTRRFRPWTTRLFSILGVFLTILFASCIYNLDYYSPKPPPPPLRVIAALSSEHLQRSLDLGQNLLNLSRTYGFADIRRGYDVIGLERQVKSLSSDASSALLVTEEMLTRIIKRARSPAAYASVNINMIRETIHGLMTEVKELHEDTDDVDLEKTLMLKDRVNAAYEYIPLELAWIEEFLTAACEHCEIIQHMNGIAMPILPGLMTALGIVRPWFFLSAWSWDRDPRVQERLRRYNSVEEVFQESVLHCEAVNMTMASLQRYYGSSDLLRPYHYLLALNDSKFPSVEESLASASFYHSELEQFTAIAKRAYQAQYKRDDDT